jgi:apolipoprotein N-acyltransferase
MGHPALRPPRWRRSAIGVAIVLVAWLGFGVSQLSRAREAGASVRVGLVQPDLPRRVRLDPSQERRVLAQLIALSRYAHGRGAELILWPEYAIERVVPSASLERRAIDALSAETGASLVVGMISARDDGFANSILLLENGTEAGRYDKVELMPFGEMRPLGGALGGHDYGLVAGVDRAPLASRVGRIGVLSCNEVMSSAPARATTRAGAQLLANFANDEWFGRFGLRQQMRIATLRAVETRRYLVRATQSGITAAIDPFGRVVQEAGIGAAGVLVADVQLRDEPSLYVRWGDRPVQIAALVALASGAIAMAHRDPRNAARPRVL